MPRSKSRRSYTLRLQPYEGTPLAEVVDYLNGMEGADANGTLANLLVMSLLPLARYHAGGHPPEKLRVTCLESCDALSKHASYLRQVTGVSQPQFDSVYLVVGNSVGTAGASEFPKSPTAKSPDISSKLSGKENGADFQDESEILDEIFGNGKC